MSKLSKTESRRLLISIFFPSIFVISIWLVKMFEIAAEISFVQLGIRPKEIVGLVGIILSPFIHGDFNHLISNTLPVFVLSSLIFYFYREKAFRIILFLWLSIGLLVWLVARQSYHIGASGLIYGFASFIFFSGISTKNRTLIAVSLLVSLIYGSMIWGAFPLQKGVSWESHLVGLLAGIIFAIYYRKYSENLNKESQTVIFRDYTSVHSTDCNYLLKYRFKESENIE